MPDDATADAARLGVPDIREVAAGRGVGDAVLGSALG